MTFTTLSPLRLGFYCAILASLCLQLSAEPASPKPPPAASLAVTPAEVEADKLPPSDQPAAPESIPLSPGDSVSIALREDSDVKFEGQIGESGIVRIPYLGDFRLAGQTPAEATKALETALTRDLYQEAHVSLHVSVRAPGTVYVYGAVKEPGAVPIPEGGNLTVLQALSQVGGITSWAQPNACHVTRTVPLTRERIRIKVDLESAFRDIGGREDIILNNADVVFVPAANSGPAQMLSTEPCEVIVVGEVITPGIVAFAPGETHTIMRAIFKAGNFTRYANSKQVRLVRYEGGERVVDKVDVAEIMSKGLLDHDIEMRPGDMVIVDRIEPGTVYVYGAVKTPGPVQLPISGDQTILQTISQVGGVTSWADPANSYLTRLTGDGEKREHIAVDLLAAFQDVGGTRDTKLQNGDVIYVPATNAQIGQVLSSDPCEVIVVGEVNNPGIVTFAPGEARTLMRAIIKAGNLSRFAKSKSVRLVRYEKGDRSVKTVDIGQIMEEGRIENDVDLQPGDMIIVDTKMFSFN